MRFVPIFRVGCVAALIALAPLAAAQAANPSNSKEASPCAAIGLFEAQTAGQIDKGQHYNHSCLRPCGDRRTDLDRDGENGVHPELLHRRRQAADAVWQSGQLYALAMGRHGTDRAAIS